MVITGATSGIGYEVAKELAKRGKLIRYNLCLNFSQQFWILGAQILIGARDPQSGEVTCRRLIADSSNKSIEFLRLDLESLASVDEFVDQIYGRVENLFCLVNNAACFYLPPKTTLDGFERTYQTNYLSPFHLTQSLLPLLERGTAQSCIINVSSAGHLQAKRIPDFDYHIGFTDCVKNRFAAYFYSKLCLVAYSWQLKNQLANGSVRVHCVDPGNTETAIFRHFPPLSNRFLFYLQKPLRYFLIKTPEEGAQGILHTILCPKPVPFYIEDTRESENVNPLIYESKKWTALKNRLWTECQGRDRDRGSSPGSTKNRD